MSSMLSGHQAPCTCEWKNAAAADDLAHVTRRGLLQHSMPTSPGPRTQKELSWQAAGLYNQGLGSKLETLNPSWILTSVAAVLLAAMSSKEENSRALLNRGSEASLATASNCPTEVSISCSNSRGHYQQRSQRSSL